MQVELSDSRTDFLLMHSDAKSFMPANDRQPDDGDLLAMLQFIVAAYETKTTKNLGGKWKQGLCASTFLCWCMPFTKFCCGAGNICQAWAQCAAEALNLVPNDQDRL